MTEKNNHQTNPATPYQSFVNKVTSRQVRRLFWVAVFVPFLCGNQFAVPESDFLFHLQILTRLET